MCVGLCLTRLVTTAGIESISAVVTAVAKNKEQALGNTDKEKSLETTIE